MSWEDRFVFFVHFWFSIGCWELTRWMVKRVVRWHKRRVALKKWYAFDALKEERKNDYLHRRN